MKNVFFFLSIAFLSFWGCASGSKVMTAEEFSEISVGQTSDDIQKKHGKPYSIKRLGDNEVEYTYIERLPMGKRVLRETHYLIILKNGKVTSTQVRTFNRPVYERNSYEMQTSYKGDDEKEANKEAT
ncbi:MAG: hypothetical protein KR126chlam4_01074 [Candidatus Anoxychlamydiales bacterium]|nr:hypothetical protein [Candidatus Anoxychlamydiales bacterium]NGX41235.1 hypothetical protein [Candidatus Anoxychlamydiales bacterium]HEU63809.1 hypothetical protein [Chlamydiota bacterium]